MSHILIAGLGDLGRGLAENLLAAGHRVSGIRRGSDAPSGVDLYSQDLLDGARLLPPDRVDLLVIIMTPSEYSEEGYLKAYVRAPLNLLDALAEQQPLPPVLFVSSSAVFGDLEGDVDETTPPAPTRYNGKIVLAAEQEVSTRGLTTVVRFSDQAMVEAYKSTDGSELLSPMTTENKKALKDWVAEFYASGKTNYEAALETEEEAEKRAESVMGNPEESLAAAASLTRGWSWVERERGRLEGGGEDKVE